MLALWSRPIAAGLQELQVSGTAANLRIIAISRKELEKLGWVHLLQIDWPFSATAESQSERNTYPKSERKEGRRGRERNDYGRKATSDPNRGDLEVTLAASPSSIFLTSSVLRQMNEAQMLISVIMNWCFCESKVSALREGWGRWEFNTFMWYICWEITIWWYTLQARENKCMLKTLQVLWKEKGNSKKKEKRYYMATAQLICFENQWELQLHLLKARSGKQCP